MKSLFVVRGRRPRLPELGLAKRGGLVFVVAATVVLTLFVKLGRPFALYGAD